MKAGKKINQKYNTNIYEPHYEPSQIKGMTMYNPNWARLVQYYK